MSYLVIARKYRPQTFEEVVGQEHITQTLKNAIKLEKISHAYLFTGPRGIGKTTTARILAKTVNCAKGKDQEPCNKCDSCTEITNSQSVDIIEIDAASNRGIDEIRELRKNVKFAPSSAKYKVYIIDEVHMLTKPAFNAILKTLEEPPPHVIFIMATTEPEKVLDTITSRCQTFNFKLIPENKIKDALQDIAKKEKAKYEEEGLWMIAQAAEGSMRDGQSIMDQVLSFSGGKINAEDVRSLLGLIPRDFLFSYTDSIKQMDVKNALKLTDDLLKEGYNLSRLFNDLLMHFRNLMFAKVFGEATGFLGFNDDYSKRLSQTSEDFSQEQLIWITEFLTRNAGRMKYTENSHVVMDTILFKLCQKYVSFDDILQTAGRGEDIPEPVKVIEPVAKKETPEPEEQEKQSGSFDFIPETETEKKEEQPAQRLKEPKKGGKWEKILALIKEESQPLYHSLKDSKAVLNKKQNKIVIEYTALLDLTDRQNTILKEKIIEIMGSGFYAEIKKKDKHPASPEIKPADKPKKPQISPTVIEKEEPLIADIVEIFNGKIEQQ
ncbi:DNA polymerase III subunit gamma/tau [Elusimicrobiota bacterium]